MRRSIVKLAVLIIMVFSLLAGCGDKVKPGTAPVKRQSVTGITTEKIRLATVDENYETSGTVMAKTESAVASRTMGTVTSIRVKEGDRVAAGQLLLTLDDRDMVQKVNAAREGYNEAERGLEAAKENKTLTDITYGRYKKLYDEKALSRQELDQVDTQKKIAEIDFGRAQAALQRAKAGMNEAGVYHGFTRIVSPVHGIVTDKKVDLGSMAVPGTPLLTVEDDSAYRIEVKGDESLTGKVRPGMPASVHIAALETDFPAKITDVVPSVDPMSRSFVIKIALKGTGLRNGFYGKVAIPIGRKQALLVPKSSVVEKGQLTGVYTVGRDSVISFRLVKTGKMYGEGVEVLSGLNPDDEVIVGGVENAIDGGLAVKQN